MRFSIREIQEEDIDSMAKIIKTTMTEFGACGPGFSINDPEVNNMFEAYAHKGHVYFVISDGNNIFGGAGIAPLSPDDHHTCELRKMYFLPTIRNQGLGQALMERCLSAAKDLGYTHCYLETLTGMTGAEKLYLKSGFKKIDQPMGNTGHFGCDSYYLKTLD